ncbi:MAG TPA: universal stress protein [Gaiellaceae bacterium]|jgi:nucleotide-binding universal stress UspA family protein|nr:universal stress protein [Gaiellaceae bacterium]
MNGPVVCGIDDSSTPLEAVWAARELADRYELPLLYVHVLDGDGGDERAGIALREAGLAEDAELVIEHGHPADRLVALAEERNASFLVVSNHGPRSSLLGSISADVARRAPCPVLVVPPTMRTTGEAIDTTMEGVTGR